MDDIERKLWNRVNRYAWWLRFVPFLRMLAVCNNLSFSRVGDDSDIDLFIVARTGRLFIVRSFSIFILHVLGVRLHGKKIRGRFCLSFFVDDAALDLSKIAISRDLYLAFWIKSLVPIFDDGVSDELVTANSWAKNYFDSDDDFQIRKNRLMINDSIFRRLLAYLLSGGFGDFIERKLLNWQKDRAKKKARSITGEDVSLIIEDHILKFHHHDRRRDFSEKWFKTYGENVKLNDERFLSLWR